MLMSAKYGYRYSKLLKVNNNFTVKNWTHSTQHFNFIIADFEHVFFNLHQEFQKYVIPFQPSAGSHTKTSQLICSANQVTYIFMKCNTRLKRVIHFLWVFHNRYTWQSLFNFFASVYYDFVAAFIFDYNS